MLSNYTDPIPKDIINYFDIVQAFYNNICTMWPQSIGHNVGALLGLNVIIFVTNIRLDKMFPHCDVWFESDAEVYLHIYITLDALSAIAHLPICFWPMTLFQNMGLNNVQSDSLWPNFILKYGILQDISRFCNVVLVVFGAVDLPSPYCMSVHFQEIWKFGWSCLHIYIAITRNILIHIQISFFPRLR